MATPHDERQYKQRGGAVIEWHFYQCRAYHQYGRTACTGLCISEEVARQAVVGFLTQVLGKGLNLTAYLQDAAKELAADPDRAGALKAEAQEAEAGMKRLADAVAAGALDTEAAWAKNLSYGRRRSGPRSGSPPSPLE